MSNSFVASRISGGNHLLPARIDIHDHGITISVPGIFNSKSADIPYQHVLAVKSDTPLVGYSRIYFSIFDRGDFWVSGFTKDQVTQMRDLIQQHKSGKNPSISNSTTINIPTHAAPVQQVERESDEVKLRRMELEAEKLRMEAADQERADRENKEFIEAAIKYWKIWVPIAIVILAVLYFKSHP